MSQNRKKQIDLFKGLTEKELSHKINEIRRELFKARLMIKSSSLKDVSIVKNLKKDIARGLTIMGSSFVNNKK